MVIFKYKIIHPPPSVSPKTCSEIVFQEDVPCLLVLWLHILLGTYITYAWRNAYPHLRTLTGVLW